MPNANDQTIPYPTSGRPSIPIVNGVATVPANSDDAAVITLTGNASVTLRTPPVGYRTLDVLLVQDSVGGRTVTWNTTIKWAGGAAPYVDGAAGATTRVTLLWDNGTWYERQTGEAAATRASSGLQRPSGLRRWRAAYGDAGVGTTKQPVITCLGDSLTAGQFAWNSTDLSSSNWVTGRTNGWVGRLRSLFSAQFGDPGEGFLFIPTAPVQQSVLDNRVVVTAGTVVACGPFGVGYAVGNGQSITITTPQCTSIELFGLWRNGSNAAFTYTVDGGASQNGPTHNSADLMYAFDISGLADTTHTLVINGPATLRADIAGAVCRRGTAAGVLVNRVGRGSTMADLAVYNTLPAARSWVLQATFTLQRTDLAIVMFRINEVLNNYSPAAFRTNLKILTDFVAAMGGCTLLVPDPVSSTVGTHAFAEYRAQMVDLAADDDHVAFLDIDRYWGGPAWTGDDLGLRVENVHPNSKGHGDLARIIHRAITQSLESV